MLGMEALGYVRRYRRRSIVSAIGGDKICGSVSGEYSWANDIPSSYLGFFMVEASSPTTILWRFTLPEHLWGDSTRFYNTHLTVAEVFPK